MASGWLVEWRLPPHDWLQRHRPSWDEAMAMVLWVGEQELHGPVDEATGTNQVVDGPNGVPILYRAWAAPAGEAVDGYMYVIRIG